MAEVAAGVLLVGTTGGGEVVINHPDLQPDAQGMGHIVFSPAQARALGDLMGAKAEEARWEILRATRAEGAARQEASGGQLGPPPKHAFEVQIRIGGDDWEYVMRTLRELVPHLEDHGSDCKMMSGGAGGCHSVDVQKRDVAPEDYHRELMVWSGRD